ncbi:MAG: GMC oxidoreductase [Chloroflexota bacterium]
MPILGHPLIRLEHKKWRQQLMLKFVYEDLPLEQNYVKFDASNPDIPETIYVRHSDYAQKAIDILPDLLPNLVKPLPVENVTFSPLSVTESHVLGTVVMGNDPQTSVVDRHLIHHDIRNLLVLGGSSFPTTAPANPTLTISALSLWAAAHLFG